MNNGVQEQIEIQLPPPPSLNKFYAGKHWGYRKKMADEYKGLVKEALAAFDPIHFSIFRLDIYYNHRYDCDNAILCSKFVADALVSEGFVENDTPTYFKSIKITYDPELEKKQFLVKIKYYE